MPKVPNSNSPELNIFAAGVIFVCVPLGLILITLKVLGVL